MPCHFKHLAIKKRSNVDDFLVTQYVIIKCILKDHCISRSLFTYANEFKITIKTFIEA